MGVIRNEKVDSVPYVGADTPPHLRFCKKNLENIGPALALAADNPNEFFFGDNNSSQPMTNKPIVRLNQPPMHSLTQSMISLIIIILL